MSTKLIWLLKHSTMMGSRIKQLGFAQEPVEDAQCEPTSGTIVRHGVHYLRTAHRVPARIHADHHCVFVTTPARHPTRPQFYERSHPRTYGRRHAQRMCALRRRPGEAVAYSRSRHPQIIAISGSRLLDFLVANLLTQETLITGEVRTTVADLAELPARRIVRTWLMGIVVVGRCARRCTLGASAGRHRWQGQTRGD
jgi:hypothetical protein